MANIVEILFKQTGAEKVAGSTGKVTKNLKAAGAAALKYTAGIGVLLVAANKLVEAHGIQARAEAQLALVLGKTSKALLNQATALQRMTRYGDEAIIGVQASIGAFIKDEAQIKAATAATLDLAAATGMDLKGAGDLIAKTLGSSTNAMSRYGIEVNGAVGSTERLESLTTNINKLYEGSAVAAAEATIGIDQLKMTMGDLAEVAGSKLAPMMNLVGLALANIFQGAPGSEWWEGVAIGMEGATRESQKLTMQAGGIDRLIQDYGKLSAEMGESGLTEVFASLGLEYDTMATRQENLNFLEGMSEVMIRKINAARIEEAKVIQAAAEATQEAFQSMGFEYDMSATKIENLNTLNSEQKAGVQAIIAAKAEEAGAFQISTKEIEAYTSATELMNQTMTDSERKMKVLQPEGLKTAKMFKATSLPVNDLTTDFQKFEEGSKLAFEGAGNAATAASAIIAAAAGEDKERQILAMRIAQIAALINTAQAVTKALTVGVAPWTFINAAAVAAAGAIQISTIQGAINSARSAATGLDEVFDKPTLIEVGDQRQGERVQITPEGGEAAGAMGITVNIYSPITYPGFTRDVILPEIREALRLGI